MFSCFEFLSDRYEDLRKDISAIRNNEILKEENVALKADLQDAHRKLSIQDNLLHDAEQYSRGDCLEVRGIPVQESDENTNSIVQAVDDFTGVPVAESEISASHRLRVNKFTNRDPAIIVKFVRRDVRDNFYKS